MKKFLLILLLITTAARAGNVLPIKQFSATNGANKHDYVFTENPTVFFDRDISDELIERVITQLNDRLVDIKLIPEKSLTDYGHAITVVNSWRKPNRFFVHNGHGWLGGGFSANLRSYSDDGGTCLVKLEKDVFDTAPFEKQAQILEHELMHCLRWNHSLFTQDLHAYDNYEPLLRIFDKKNTKKVVEVKLNETTYFSNKLIKAASRDAVIKIPAGRYKVNGKPKRIRYKPKAKSK